MIVQWARPPRTAPAQAMPPSEAIHRLAAALRQYGFQRLYQAHADGISVLSVAAGLTVWCREGTFWWGAGDRRLVQRADSPEGTALIIAKQHCRVPH